MTVIIISIIVAWIVFAGLLVTVLCMFSSKINQQQDKLQRQIDELDEFPEQTDEHMAAEAE